MKARGRFGLIIPEINSPLDHDLVEGAYAQASILGYDLIIYTGIYNSIRELRYDAYISGLENIYSLVCRHDLDGVIFAEERFHTQEVIKKIYGYLSQTETPCIILGGDHTGSNVMNADEYASMYRITRHLTDEHGCRKLYCLAGVQGHFSSEERLRGFTDACRDSHIEISESDIIYGNFWKKIPEQLGQDIAEGRIEKPDGVVCCNDAMAVALIESLTRNGINVPEDVKVTGYDGELDSLLCTPSVTTVSGRDRQFGADAVCRLYTKITGRPCKQDMFDQSIRYGRSCGCCKDPAVDRHLLDIVVQGRERRQYIATDFIHSMSEAEDIEELGEAIDNVGHIFSGVEWLDICLCSDWQGDMMNPDSFRQYGCSDDMYLLLSKRYGYKEKVHYTFSLSEVLPALNRPHEPKIVVLTSLHCGGQIFGYTAAAYTDSHRISADGYFLSWCDSISNGIKTLQKRLHKLHYYQQITKLSEKDPDTGIFNRRGFMLNAAGYINEIKNENRDSYLLLITYYPDAVGTLSPETAIGNLLAEFCSNRLLGKLSETLFAVMIPAADEQAAANTAQNLVAAIESGLGEHFGSTKLPEFIVNVSKMGSEDVSDIEKRVSEAISSVSDKKKALENNYVDYKDNILRLRRRIQSDPQNEWSVDDMARDIGISRSHLQRLYKILFSVSVKDDVINFRIQRAMQLLTHTSMRVQEIAEMCGYNSDNHFMRQFKEKTGITPAQFRKGVSTKDTA